MILRNLNIVGRKEEPNDIKIEKEFISEIKPSRILNSASGDFEIDFEECIAFPGLINSHDHLEFNLYPQLGHKVYSDYVEWGSDIHLKDKEIIESIESVPVDLRMKYGIVKNLLNGVTAVAHHGAYNSCLDDSPVDIIKKGTDIHSVRLGGRWKLKLNWVKNLEPYVIHIGEGINGESFDEIDELIRWNLFGRKIIGIHGISMTEEQSKNFEALIWSPVSNQFLFNKTADLGTIKKNTKILFGTDSTLTAGWNIWEHLRNARLTGLLSDEELFASVTKTGAEVWDLKNTGEISEGMTADVIIAEKKSENLFESFYQINPEDILLVLKSGKIILFDETVKHSVISQKDEFINFNKVNVNGKTKFIKYEVEKTLDKLKSFKPIGHLQSNHSGDYLF